MCGIVGMNGDDRQLIRRMSAALIHRGPDDAGVFCDTGVSLAHRRLSIIDVSSRGHQPMSTADGSLLIVFNGEIYNHQVLRGELERKGYRYRGESDTETLLYGYEEWGEKVLDRLNGDFAFCVYDRKKKIK